MPYEMYSSEDKVMNYSKELYHHGILGQRWGIRRFQNKDGSLTSAGKKRYGDGNFEGKEKPSTWISKKEVKQLVKDYNKVNGTHFRYGPDTMVKKGDDLYDYKGRKIETGHEVSSRNKFVDKYSRIGSKTNQFSERRLKTIEELRDELTRKQLEKQISDIDKDKVRSGEEHVDQVLKNIGNMLAIGATVASVVVAAQGNVQNKDGEWVQTKSDSQRVNEVLQKGKGLPGQIITFRKGLR